MIYNAYRNPIAVESYDQDLQDLEKRNAISACQKEIEQHKKDLEAALDPIEREWLQDELDYWKSELTKLMK
jgi:hypothetical protein